MKKLTGKRVLITGAARGIGLEMAIKFAESGSEIVLTDLREEALPEAREIVEVLGVPVHTFALDVSDNAAIATFKSRLDAEIGPIDLLVNNAGVVFGGPFADVPLEKHVLTYNVNVLGVVAMTHAFLPDLISRPEAHLVNIASASGFIGLPYGSTYASSKWAVIGFSESIRAELDLVGHDHVNVTTVCPSYIGTGMFEGVKPPTSTRMLAPEEIAVRIVEAVQSDQAYVLEPWLVKVTPPLKAFLPTRLFDMVASMLGANTGMSGWTGHGDAAPEPVTADKDDT
jgi:short-subunit dehydrogenase